MNRYDRYPGDYLRATLILTLAQDGAYTRLLDWYYSTEKPIEDSTKFAVTRCASEEDREVTQWVLDRFFEFEPSNGGRWIHARAEQEIAKAAPRIAAAKNNGKRGGRPPRGNPVGLPVGNPALNPGETHAGEGEGVSLSAVQSWDQPTRSDHPPDGDPDDFVPEFEVPPLEPDSPRKSGIRRPPPPPALTLTERLVGPQPRPNSYPNEPPPGFYEEPSDPSLDRVPFRMHGEWDPGPGALIGTKVPLGTVGLYDAILEEFKAYWVPQRKAQLDSQWRGAFASRAVQTYRDVAARLERANKPQRQPQPEPIIGSNGKPAIQLTPAEAAKWS